MGRQKRRRRSFTPEFKAEAVKVVQQSGKSVAMVARELDLTETALADDRVEAPPLPVDGTVGHGQHERAHESTRSFLRTASSTKASCCVEIASGPPKLPVHTRQRGAAASLSSRSACAGRSGPARPSCGGRASS